MYPRAFKEKAWGYNIQARGGYDKGLFSFLRVSGMWFGHGF